MAKAPSLKKRLEGFFIAHPEDSYNVEALMRVFKDANEGTVRVHLSDLAKRHGLQGACIVKDTYRRGFWKFNPSYKTVEELRGKVLDHINDHQRVIQSTKGFSAVESPITSVEDPALPLRRLFFTSILERMSKSDQFSAADIELLRREAPHLSKEKELR